MTPWYATWFNTPYYHDLYSHRDHREARTLIQTLCKALKVEPGQRALDIACGRGRHAMVLAESGLHTVGIDLSPESIGVASEMAHDHLSFQVGNMLEPLEVESAHWVFNLFTSFGYFEDDAMHQQAIENMANALLPGGKLVLDYMNAEKIAAELVPKDQVKTDLATYEISRRVEDQTIVKSIKLSEDGCSIFNYEERVRAFSETELRAFMERAGLRVKSVHGDYELGTFDPEYSDRLIIIAEKSAHP
jgi:cyclopropane fatty-acyl-phospholipid synthase-like methyltransferase